MLNWFVVIAKPNHDFAVAKALREQKFADVYLPHKYEKQRLASGRTVPVPGLLLPPYVLVLLDPAKDQHSGIKNTWGVSSLLSTVEERPQPKPLRNGFQYVADLKQAEDDERKGADPITSRMDLKRGMLVRIDKPLLTRSGEGEYVPLEGKITLIRRRKLCVQIEERTVWVGEEDVTPL